MVLRKLMHEVNKMNTKKQIKNELSEIKKELYEAYDLRKKLCSMIENNKKVGEITILTNQWDMKKLEGQRRKKLCELMGFTM